MSQRPSALLTDCSDRGRVTGHPELANHFRFADHAAGTV
jgi:hypothetical protein